MLAQNVLMYHNDVASTGENLGESTLSPQNVDAGQFGKLFSAPLDGQVYAQPLYASGVQITSGGLAGVHDVVVAATEHNSLYAIDAASGDVLWHDSFIDPAAGITTVPSADALSASISPELGITSTPVIDLGTNAIYVEARTKELRSGQMHYVHRLHAIDLASGKEMLGGPLTLADTILNADGSYVYVSGPAVNGRGDGAQAGVVPFNAVREHQRAALSLVAGTVYIAFASLGDNGPYHGWLLGVDARHLTLTAAFNTTPNGSAGGIWQSGAAAASDAQGNLYVVTGNGSFDAPLAPDGLPALGDYGDSVLKLAIDPGSSPTDQNANGWGLKVVDFFSPSNQQSLSAVDADLGSGGVLVLPDSAGSAAHPHLLSVADKAGTIYLLDRDQLGGFDSAGDHVLEEWTAMPNGGFDTPAFYQGAVYFGGAGAPLERFTTDAGAMSDVPDSMSPEILGGPGATVSVSAQGASGIAWVLDPGSNQLLAYDAANVAHRLYGSNEAPGGRDALGAVIKFSVPTIAQGRVFVGTANTLAAFGLIPAGNLTPPTDGQLIVPSTTEQTLLDAIPLATFSAPSPSQSADWFHAAIAWGDGSFSVGSVTSQRSGYLVTGSHTYADEGAWPLTIVVSNPAGVLRLSGEANVVERLMPDGSQGTAGDRFLSELYDDLLGRPLDAAGWSFWARMADPTSSRPALAARAAATTEFRQHEVQQLFLKYLGRTAEPDAAAYFEQQLLAGATVEQLAAELLGSAEYFQQRGGGVNSRFLNVIYRDVLQRPIDDEARLFWGQALLQGLSRQNVAQVMLASSEYRRLVVEDDYERLLNRPADDAGLTMFVTQLGDGVRQEQIVALMAASEEYFAKIAN